MIAKLISEDECLSEMPQPEYGYDAYGNKLQAPDGHEILPRGTELLETDCPFDLYSGWFLDWHLDIKFNHHAYNSGRWSAFARKVSNHD